MTARKPRLREEVLLSDWHSVLVTLNIIEDQLADGVPLRVPAGEAKRTDPAWYMRENLQSRIAAIVEKIEWV